MIDEPGHPTGHLVIAQEETTMLKTISAALLAVSVLAAPAMAAGRPEGDLNYRVKRRSPRPCRVGACKGGTLKLL